MTTVIKDEKEATKRRLVNKRIVSVSLYSFKFRGVLSKQVFKWRKWFFAKL